MNAMILHRCHVLIKFCNNGFNIFFPNVLFWYLLRNLQWIGLYSLFLSQQPLFELHYTGFLVSVWLQSQLLF